MNIECPNCGFSGRVPGYVADIPHHARCPKCRFGFDISDLVARAPELAEPTAPPAPWDAPSESSSSNSSYEIEAIGGVWEDEEDPAPRPAPKPALVASASPSAGDPMAIGPDGLLDWRVRLLEAWAIALLVWAALIGSRVVYATLVRGDELVFSQAFFWPVAAVVLLVAAAAGLLLALEFGRRPASAPNIVAHATALIKRRRLASAKGGSD